MQIMKSEDCLLFIGLTPKITKISGIYNTLSKFMKNKQELDTSDRFNLIVFQKNGPIYLDHFTLNPKIILKTLKSLQKHIVKANIAGGIFVAITFIIEIYKMKKFG